MLCSCNFTILVLIGSAAGHQGAGPDACNGCVSASLPQVSDEHPRKQQSLPSVLPRPPRLPPRDQDKHQPKVSMVVCVPYHFVLPNVKCY